jgi:hypothetical protein
MVADPIEQELAEVYEEIMWLARRSNIRPSVARGWYTHARSGRLKRHVRLFTGKVSKEALKDGAILRLEHFKRMQTTLTQLVAKHLKLELNDPKEFVRVVLDCEQVHLVTFKENYAALKNKSDYVLAGIDLIDWREISPEKQTFLWWRVLRGNVANADTFPHGHRVPLTGQNHIASAS